MPQLPTATANLKEKKKTWTHYFDWNKYDLASIRMKNVLVLSLGFTNWLEGLSKLEQEQYPNIKLVRINHPCIMKQSVPQFRGNFCTERSKGFRNASEPKMSSALFIISTKKDNLMHSNGLTILKILSFAWWVEESRKSNQFQLISSSFRRP